MNLIEHYVTEVLSEPYEKYNAWFVDVKVTCYGHESIQSIYCKTEEDAKNVKIGHMFLA